jgi:hypothetical protein
MEPGASSMLGHSLLFLKCLVSSIKERRQCSLGQGKHMLEKASGMELGGLASLCCVTDRLWLLPSGTYSPTTTNLVSVHIVGNQAWCTQL